MANKKSKPKRRVGFRVCIKIERFVYDPQIGSSARHVLVLNVISPHGDWTLGEYDTLEEADNAIRSIIEVKEQRK